MEKLVNASAKRRREPKLRFPFDLMEKLILLLTVVVILLLLFCSLSQAFGC